ncbi:prolipoprotein diacylglyceryl transferase [soil metagenome]
MEPSAVLTFPNIDPVIFEIGPFVVRWYALSYIAAILFAIWYIKRLVANPALWAGRTPTLAPVQVDDLLIYIALGIVLGGRIGYVLFYNPQHFLSHPADAIRMWEGGMSFHGGFLGVVAALILYGRRTGARLDRLLDLGAATAPVGLGLGRVANFINGELYGRVSDVPWAMIFPGDPTALPRHPSQLYEAGLEGLVLFTAVRIATHHFKALSRPGEASGIFALGYGICRIIAECFREPDVQLGYFAGFLTMGMILSVPLILIGIWLLWRARRDERHAA